MDEILPTCSNRIGHIEKDERGQFQVSLKRGLLLVLQREVRVAQLTTHVFLVVVVQTEALRAAVVIVDDQRLTPRQLAQESHVTLSEMRIQLE